VLVGVLLGGLAGYFGGAVDFVFLRVVEVLQSFPAFLLTLTGVALVPARTLHPMLTIALVIAFVGWTGVGRLVRAELLRLRELELTTAARALGLSPLRIAFRHLLPAALPPVLVAAAFATSNAVLTESAISFLGLGIGPPTPSWGALIAVERDAGAWWLQVFPGLMVFLTVVSYNLVGEGLREALDPAEARLGVGGRALRQGAPS
jgi:peptide/nickel transport system permease protein